MIKEDAKTDVVVIGGGMAGLSTAALLARKGLSVKLFEKSAEIGGRAATQTYEGFSLNRGIHALYLGGATEEVLQELGVAYKGGKPKGVFVAHRGELHTFPATPSDLMRSKLFNAADKFDLMRVFAVLPMLKAEKLRNVSIRTWISKNISRPLPRQLMEAMAETFVYSTALDLASADVFVRKMQLFLKYGVLYIDGGWQQMTSGLRRVAEAAGVQIMSGARVETVEYSDGRTDGVRLSDGNRISTAAVVIAMAPGDAVRLLDGGSYAPLRRIVDGLVPVQSAALDVALNRLPVQGHPVVQDMDKPNFLSTQSLFARVAPEGGATISLFKQLDPRIPSDPRADERELETFLDLVQPGWRDVLVKRIYLPRIEVAGALPLAANGGLAGRPQPEVPGIANLYLAGDWIGAEGFLVDASMASARQVAKLVAERTPAAMPATRRGALAAAAR